MNVNRARPGLRLSTREWLCVATLAAVACGPLLVGGRWSALVLMYYGAVLLPGGAIVAVARRRILPRPLPLLEAFLFSNLAGLSVLIAIGWMAARLGIFSAIGVGLAAFALGLVLSGTGVTSFVGQVRRCIAGARVSDGGFFALAAVVSFLLLIPALVVLAGGSQVGLDTFAFSRVGDVIAQTGSWPQLSVAWKPLVGQGDMAPGLPVLYGAFGGVFGSPSIQLAVIENIVPFVLSSLAMFVFVGDFVRSRLVAGAVSICWLLSSNSGTLLLNVLINNGVSGASPDAVLATPFFVVLLVLCVRLVRSNHPSLGEVGLLSLMFLGVVLLNQLVFLMAALLLIVTGVTLAWRQGLGWLGKAALLVAAPVLVFIPDYLVPSQASASSPALTGHATVGVATFLHWTSASTLFLQVGWLGFLGGTLALLGIAFALAGRIRHRPVTSTRDSRGSFVLGVTGFVYLPFAFTSLGSSLLGIYPGRFYAYPEVLAVPFVALAFQGTADIVVATVRRRRPPGHGPPNARPRRTFPTSQVVAVAVTALFVGAAVVAANATWTLEQKQLAPKRLYDSSQAAAGNWLRDHANANATVAVDSNGGNTGIDGLLAYAGHRLIIRPWSLLYSELTSSAGRSGLPLQMVNNVITDPSAANAEVAWKAFNVQYYVFQQGYSDKQITAFSHLSYFPTVYAASGLFIFEFDPSKANDSFFVPATSFTSASSLVATKAIGSAYNASYSVPLSPNSVGSSSNYGEKFDGSTVNYTIDVGRAGTYTLWVDRQSLQLSEYLNVTGPGGQEGRLNSTSLGWSLGDSFTMVLPSGEVSLKLTFYGTVNWADLIDYLLLT